MKPLELIYWLRLALGFVAAVTCVGYGLAANIIPHNPPQDGFPNDLHLLFNSASIAVIVYLVSYMIIKRKFLLQVDKPSKLVTTGIGIYFLSWIVFWTLFYSIIAGQPAPS